MVSARTCSLSKAEQSTPKFVLTLLADRHSIQRVSDRNGSRRRFCMSQEASARHRVLIADDDAPTRRGVSKLLESAGFEVSEAADGIAALNAIQEKQYDLVFLDIW